MTALPHLSSKARTGNFALWCVRVIVIGYLVAWTFGIVLGIAFLLGLITDRIRVHGYGRLVSAAFRGKVIFAMNHPSLSEPFIVPALLFPLYLVFPWCFPWSSPDQKLLGEWHMPEWQRIALRCIVFDRTRKMVSGRAWKKARKVLERLNAIFIFFPEEGRTKGAANKHRIPLSSNGRILQKVNSSMLRHAHKANAWVLPIHLKTDDGAETNAFWANFRRSIGVKMIFTVGHLYKPGYKPGQPFDLEAANRILEHKILHAGELEA